ncbi:GNAT family N-acetyltransferase [Pseudonocardia sp. GCM10023141]|uniref:GNAT family N-acetyltransferase n=1 Tax=Pseudonocardia sp. GCM10023141 TaxID=3252653 RepID=UPI00360994BA
MVDDLLDNSAWTAMTGPQSHLAERIGNATRYRPDVAGFSALPLTPTAADWADLAELTGPGRTTVISGPRRVAPTGWEVTALVDGVQFDGTGLRVEPDPEAVVLGVDDVPEMMDLVERTQPGPFRTGTHLLGTYLGIRRDGRLVAMAGERVRPPGWSEISAVCTDASVRGQGLATRLVRAVGAVIRERGDVPFLHTGAANTTAIRLYEHIGFVLRMRTEFTELRAPALVTAAGGPGARSRAEPGPAA